MVDFDQLLAGDGRRGKGWRLRAAPTWRTRSRAIRDDACRRNRFDVDERVRRLSRGAVARAAAACVIVSGVALAACQDKLDTSAACPSLCPGQSVLLRDTVLEGVAMGFDSTVSGFPAIGREAVLLVAGRGDTL